MTKLLSHRYRKVQGDRGKTQSVILMDIWFDGSKWSLLLYGLLNSTLPYILHCIDIYKQRSRAHFVFSTNYIKTNSLLWTCHRANKKPNLFKRMLLSKKLLPKCPNVFVSHLFTFFLSIFVETDFAKSSKQKQTHLLKLIRHKKPILRSVLMRTNKHLVQ